MDEPQADLERRVVRTPRTGARVCMLIGAVLLIAAGYFFLVPVRVEVSGGGSWDCGTALSPPRDAFGSGLCGKINAIYSARGVGLGLAALVVAGGGLLLFGTDRRIETRPRRTAEPDEL